VTKKFAQRVYLNSNIRSKLFGTPTAAGLLRSNVLLSFLTLNRELFALFYPQIFFQTNYINYEKSLPSFYSDFIKLQLILAKLAGDSETCKQDELIESSRIYACPDLNERPGGHRKAG